jgi:predicted RNase H-like HicB family nuclease
MMRYPMEVFWSDEDEGFIAVAPDLPGASAWGKTEAAAIKELYTAIDLWIRAAKKVGNPVPKPSDRTDENYSGKFLMRVPKWLHAELARAAKAQGVSLNQYLLYVLTKGLGERAQVRPDGRGAISRTRRAA